MKTLTYLLIAICLIGCFSTISDDELRRIDPLLKPYLDRFIIDAAENGKFVDSDIYLVFGSLSDKDAVGITYYQSKMIVIDSTSLAWKKEPEVLLYHEFGHLLLNRRGHDNSVLHNGEYKTIMNTYSSVHYEEDGLRYKREYYIKELFNQDTKYPDWSY